VLRPTANFVLIIVCVITIDRICGKKRVECRERDLLPFWWWLPPQYLILIFPRGACYRAEYYDDNRCDVMSEFCAPHSY